MKMKRWIAASLFIGFSITMSSCGILPQEQIVPPPILQVGEPTYITEEIQLKSISTSVSKVGSVYSSAIHNLSFEKRGGYITEIHVRYRQKVKKGDILISIETTDLEKQIAEQEIHVQLAQIDYDEILKNSWQGKESAAVKKSQLYLDLATMRLTELQEALEESVLRAPIDGIVTYFRSTAVGDFVEARENIVTVSDETEKTIVIIASSPQDLVDFRVGMPVDIEWNKEIFKGIVSSAPSDAPDDAFKASTPHVIVDFSDLKDAEALDIGEPLRVIYNTESREDVVVISNNAVTVYGSYAYVQVLENGVRRERTVERGISNAIEVEIVKGLEPGDLLIVR